MSDARRSVLVGALLAGCGAHATEPTRASPERSDAVPVAPVAPVVIVQETPAPRRSCRSTVAPGRHPLSHPGAPVQIGERTFAVAWRRGAQTAETVIASLDARGELVVTPVPVPFADPSVIAGDPGGLVIVSVAQHGTGTLLRVALGADGTLRPGAPTKVPDVAWGWPSTLVSDGARATLLHTLAAPAQRLGDDVMHTIDLATGRVTATVKQPAGTRTTCRAGVCTTLEISRPPTGGGPTRASFVRSGPGGEERLAVEFVSACPAFHELAEAPLWVAPGAPWRAVWSSDAPPHLREAAIDASLAAEPDCRRALAAFPSAARPGLLDEDARAVLRWDGAGRSFGAREALPPLAFSRATRAGHPDGVIEVGWKGGSGMQHSPTDAQGRRRYYKRWWFEGGQVALLRYEDAGWAAVDAAPLALALVEGTMHGGYAPIVLRNGLHAAVLLAPDGGGEDAWLQPYLAPCAAP